MFANLNGNNIVDQARKEGAAQAAAFLNGAKNFASTLVGANQRVAFA